MNFIQSRFIESINFWSWKGSHDTRKLAARQITSFEFCDYRQCIVSLFRKIIIRITGEKRQRGSSTGGERMVCVLLNWRAN